MSQFTPEQMKRLELLYAILDRSYVTLRDYSALQFAALRQGAVNATVVTDTLLGATSIGVTTTWKEIQGICAAEAPAAESPVPEPVKEVVN